jgi:histidinol-phosphate aminotransferase
MGIATAPEPDLEPVLALARAEIRALKPYAHADWDPRLERLHANELPWRAGTDASSAGLNRYPEPQPKGLLAALAKLYDVPDNQLLIGRGSDEAIDLLVRAFCRAGTDAVLVTPPTFGMYAVAARIQGAAVLEVALDAARNFTLDSAALVKALKPAVKLIFLCSPNNPTGGTIPRTDILSIVTAAKDRAVVVVDEAYIEFSDVSSLSAEIAQHPNLVVLRTLSKAHGLAGARVGTLIARPGIVALLRRIIPPYAIAQPTIEAALAALTIAQRAIARQRIASLVAERDRLAAALAQLSAIVRVWPSAANFLLVEFVEPQRAFDALVGAGLLVRDFRGQPGLARALRVTIGSPEQNDRVLHALK